MQVAVIERLKQSKELAMSLERTAFMSGGYAWAEKTASFRQLERLAKIDVEDFADQMAADDADDRAAIFWTVAEAVYQSTGGEYFEDLSALIGTPGAYPTVPMTLGFVEGAQQLLEEVADKV